MATLAGVTTFPRRLHRIGWSATRPQQRGGGLDRLREAVPHPASRCAGTVRAIGHPARKRMGDRPQGLALFSPRSPSGSTPWTQTSCAPRFLGHAEQLGPRDRAPFLERFAAPRSGPPDEPALCADVTAFVDRLRSGAYFDGCGLGRRPACGARLGRRVLDGRDRRPLLPHRRGLPGRRPRWPPRPTARRYEALTLGGEVGTFSGPGTPESMVDTDLGEARPGRLRARYVTTDPAYRGDPGRADEALEYVGPAVGLQEIADARPGALDGLAEFLEEWIALVTPPGDGRRRRALLTEAVRRRDGVDGRRGDHARAKEAWDQLTRGSSCIIAVVARADGDLTPWCLPIAGRLSLRALLDLFPRRGGGAVRLARPPQGRERRLDVHRV